ncbi:MAG: flagellar motor protein MotA [Methyloligellaceae bacterium]
MDTQNLTRTLSRPQVYLWRMIIFLVLIGFIGAVLYAPIARAFMANPALNGLIIAVLVIGTLYSFSQVTRLYPEIRWVNTFRVSEPGLSVDRKPKLLAPMANMLRDRTGHLSLSTVSMRSLMDSIASRLDEARDTSRYLVGLLIFLGLLGTFWGLLETIQSVGTTINALDTSGGDSLVIFEELKSGLQAPLSGMGTAFSSSLFGLAGSLVLGFLDLQASQSQNRFYNELEEWLSSITELGSGEGVTEASNNQMQMALMEMHRSMNELGVNIQNGIASGHGQSDEAVKELARGIDKLVKQMRAEQKVVREWVDEQAAQQVELANALREFSASVGIKRPRGR